MLVLGVVTALLAAGGTLLIAAYLSHTPTVRSRLPGGGSRPWVIAMILLLIPVVYLTVANVGTFIYESVAESPPPTGPPPVWWEFVAVIGAVVFLALMIWLAWYRPLAAAILLLIGWIAVPVSVWEQISFDFHSGSPDAASAPSGMAAIALFVLLAPSFLVALLLIATARSLADRALQQASVQDAAADRGGDSPEPTSSARSWAAGIIVLKVLGSLLITAGVLALVMFFQAGGSGPRSISQHWSPLLVALAATLAVLSVALWWRPRGSGLVLLGSSVTVLTIGTAAPLLTGTNWLHMAYVPGYAVPAFFVGCLLLLIARLERDPHTHGPAPDRGAEPKGRLVGT